MDNLSKDGSIHVTGEAVNTATHMAAAVFAALGSLLLVVQSVIDHKWWHVLSFVVYGFTLTALFTMSALHHGVNGTEKTNRRLRTLDYVAIYGLIVGTITPFCLVLFRGATGFSVLFIALLVVAFGITMRSVYHTLPSYISLTLYLCLGWLPMLLILLQPDVLPAGGFLWLLAGGIFYTGGSVIYGIQRPNPKAGIFGFHEIWHIAVILGAFCHFMLIYLYILPVR